MERDQIVSIYFDAFVQIREDILVVHSVFSVVYEMFLSRNRLVQIRRGIQRHEKFLKVLKAFIASDIIYEALLRKTT